MKKIGHKMRRNIVLSHKERQTIVEKGSGPKKNHANQHSNSPKLNIREMMQKAQYQDAKNDSPSPKKLKGSEPQSPLSKISNSFDNQKKIVLELSPKSTSKNFYLKKPSPKKQEKSFNKDQNDNLMNSRLSINSGISKSSFLPSTPKNKSNQPNYKITKTNHKVTDIVAFRETILSAKGLKYVKGYRCIDMFDDFLSFNSFRTSDRQQRLKQFMKQLEKRNKQKQDKANKLRESRMTGRGLNGSKMSQRYPGSMQKLDFIERSRRSSQVNMNYRIARNSKNTSSKKMPTLSRSRRQSQLSSMQATKPKLEEPKEKTVTIADDPNAGKNFFASIFGTAKPKPKVIEMDDSRSQHEINETIETYRNKSLSKDTVPTQKKGSRFRKQGTVSSMKYLKQQDSKLPVMLNIKEEKKKFMSSLGFKDVKLEQDEINEIYQEHLQSKNRIKPSDKSRGRKKRPQKPTSPKKKLKASEKLVMLDMMDKNWHEPHSAHQIPRKPKFMFTKTTGDPWTQGIADKNMKSKTMVKINRLDKVFITAQDETDQMQDMWTSIRKTIARSNYYNRKSPSKVDSQENSFVLRRNQSLKVNKIKGLNHMNKFDHFDEEFSRQSGRTSSHRIGSLSNTGVNFASRATDINRIKGIRRYRQFSSTKKKTKMFHPSTLMKTLEGFKDYR